MTSVAALLRDILAAVFSKVINLRGPSASSGWEVVLLSSLCHL